MATLQDCNDSKGQGCLIIFDHPRDGDLPEDGEIPRDGGCPRDGDHTDQIDYPDKHGDHSGPYKILQSYTILPKHLPPTPPQTPILHMLAMHRYKF